MPRIKKKFPKLKIKKADLRGRGVYADENIKKGQVILIFTGEVVTFDESIQRIREGLDSQDDALQVGFQLDMILSGTSHYFNHSCNPNAGVRKICELVALEDIAKGNEITFDYSTTIGPNISNSLWKMKCLCASNNCRGVVSNITTIPKKQLNYYKKNDALQDYILRELEIIKLNGGKLPKYPRINI